MRALIFALALTLAPSAVVANARDEPVQIQVGGVTLAGTLTLPESAPRAAFVLIQGAGPHARDAVISGAPLFAELAEGLAAQGVASLRIDNSGVGESTGEIVQHFMQRVPQITGAFDLLASRDDLGGVPIGLMGHSEGAMVAAEVWRERSERVGLVALIGAPVRQGRIVWVDQQSNPDRFAGHDDEGLRRIRAGFEAVADASIAGDRPRLEREADALFAVIGVPEEQLAEIRGGFLNRMGSPEMQVFLGHDPAPAYAAISAPVLAIWGGIDSLTSPSLNAPAFLENLRPDSNLTIRIMPGEDHFFLRGDGLEPGQHEFGKMSLSPRLVDVVVAWVDDLAAR